MDKHIAYCGLDCRECQAYIATQADNQALREEVAKKWSELNSVTITPEMINCDGCRVEGGRKTVFCDSLCEIKKCASAKKFVSCGICEEMHSCEHVKMIASGSEAAYKRLEDIYKSHH